MSKRSLSFSRVAVAVLSGAILLLPFVAQTASADPPWGRGWRKYERFDYPPPTRGYVIIRHTNTVVLQPVFPEAFVVRRPRFFVVQPVPVWVEPYRSVSGIVGIHTRGLNLDFAFSKQRPYYGCSFCGEYFSSYDAWARHEQYCPDHPAGRVLCEPWDDDELRACEDQAGQACRGEAYGGGDGGYYDDRAYGYDDPRYDERGCRRGDPSYHRGEGDDQGEDDNR
jgi:hypothetical protein